MVNTLKKVVLGALLGATVTVALGAVDTFAADRWDAVSDKWEEAREQMVENYKTDLAEAVAEEKAAREAVRDEEQYKYRIHEKLNKEVVFYRIDNKMVEELLGKKKFIYLENIGNAEVGVVNGMAYTVFGGDILPVEATLFKGKGDLVLTGSLGEVMQESCHIALNYIKSNMDQYHIDYSLFEKNDVHIHVPEGAVNKDGPSAGVTITTALISLFTGKKVEKSIAMTGEITLRGRVLGIGGLKEKVIGAHRAGIKTVIIPCENEKDLDEIPDEIKNDISFVSVRNYDEIFRLLFQKG